MFVPAVKDGPGWFDQARDEVMLVLADGSKYYRKGDGSWWRTDGRGNIERLDVRWEAPWVDGAARNATANHVTYLVERDLRRLDGVLTGGRDDGLRGGTIDLTPGVSPSDAEPGARRESGQHG